MKTIWAKTTIPLALFVVAFNAGFAEDQYHDFSGDFSGVDVQYAGPDSLYITSSNGAIGPNGIRIISENTPYTSVNIGYDTSGNVAANPGTVNNDSTEPTGSAGVYVETDSQGLANSSLSIKNAAHIQSMGFGVEYLVASNGNASFYNAALGVVSGNGGVHMNVRNGGTSSFTNDGSVSSTGDGATLYLEGSSQPGNAASAAIANNGRIFADGGLTAVSSANWFSAISITNSQSGTIQSTYAYTINLVGNSPGEVGQVRIDNSGQITASASSISIMINGPENVEIANGGTGQITGSVRVHEGGVFTFVNDGTLHGNTASDSIASYGNAKTFITNNGMISRRINVDADDNASEYNIKNFGTIDGLGNDAVYLNGSNGAFEYMPGAHINGGFTMLGDSNTLIIHGGANKIGGMVDLSGNTLRLVIAGGSSSGKLEAADFINLDDATSLSIDVSNASLILHDTLTIVQSDAEIFGEFSGLANGEMFWSGDYRFQIAYNASSVTLDVVEIIPESSSVAAIAGILALSLTIRHRRKH